MARLQADLSADPDVRLVSITVDPEQDTAEVLVEYASRFGANHERWLFLTGEKRAIYALAIEGFRLSVADPEKIDPPLPGKRVPPNRSAPRQGEESQPRENRTDLETRIVGIALGWMSWPPLAMAHPGHAGKPLIHSSRFVLVDRQARIRGYYRSDDAEALRRLRGDVRSLLLEKSP
jgi:cytochrome oxidase Cu insertion factor (SCO1/SenC/PrrC family)